jgi:hypothetical protein
MYLIRELMYCKPGKVRPMVEKFLAMSKLMDQSGMGKMRILTDTVAERYWTCVAEFEVDSIDRFMSMEGMDPEAAKQMEELMQGYHELIDHGKRELYKIEG